MIGSLRGILEELRPGESGVELVVDVGGVGYRLLVTNRTAAKLGPVGSEVACKVHTHVRESAITLYGFPSVEDRECFETLVTTHGVGPALALAVLGVYEPVALATVVAAGDVDALVLVPGVGRKTATRLVVELAHRLDGLLLGAATGSTGGSAASASVGGPARARAAVAEALSGLGYGSDEVAAAIAGLPDSGSVEELLRLALVTLAPRR